MMAEAVVTVGMVWIAPQVLPGIHVADQPAALTAGLVLSLIYLFIRPLARLLAKPVSCLTFGLFGTVVDAAMVMMCAAILKERFVVDSFWWALALALAMNLVLGVVRGSRENRKRKER